MKRTRCPGCGVELPALDGPVHRYMESTPACWAVYGEVLAREYQDPQLMVVHRLTVDTYAIQHPGRRSRLAIQSVGAHLISLYAILECGTGHLEATRLIRAAIERVELSWLEPPASMGPLSVQSLLNTSTPSEHLAAVRHWANSAWSAWSAHRTTVHKWFEHARAS